MRMELFKSSGCRAFLTGLIVLGLVAAPLVRGWGQSENPQPAGAANGSGAEGVIAGPWRIADQNPIVLKSDVVIQGYSAALAVVGAEQAEGNVELILWLTPDGTEGNVGMAFKFVGYDEQGTTYNFIEETTSTSQGHPQPVGGGAVTMRVYQMETPATTGFKIVSVAMVGDLDAAREKQIAADVFKAKSDLRSLQTALEAYYVDANSFPGSSARRVMVVPAKDNLNLVKVLRTGPSGPPTFLPLGPDVPMTLTTPIAYLTKMPTDPFAEEVQPGYRYYNSGKASVSAVLRENGNLKNAVVTVGGEPRPSGWIMWSAGPDRKYDIDYFQYDAANSTESERKLIPHTYDPSNGTVSPGDIWRISGDLAELKAPVLPVAIPDTDAAERPEWVSAKLNSEEMKTYAGQPGVVSIRWTHTAGTSPGRGFNIRRAISLEGGARLPFITIIIPNKTDAVPAGSFQEFSFEDTSVKVGEEYFYYVEQILNDGTVKQVSQYTKRKVERRNLKPAQ